MQDLALSNGISVKENETVRVRLIAGAVLQFIYQFLQQNSGLGGGADCGDGTVRRGPRHWSPGLR